MNKHDRMYEQIRKHGENLNQVFGLNEDPVKLSKKLHALELKANRAATCLLNTNTLDRIELTRQEEQTGNVKQATEDEQEVFFENILNKVDKILNFKAQNIPVYINYDARGYTLKIKESYVRDNNLKIYTDWGGYGILAPDFNGEV